MIIVLTFLGILSLTLGPYWLLVVRPERQAQQAVLRRLRVARQPKSVRVGLLKAAERLSAIPSMNTALTRSRAVLGPVERLIAQADLRMTVGTFVLSCACAAVLTFLVLHWLTREPLLALAVATVAGWVPVVLVKYKRSKRILKFEEQFPEALDLLSRSLKAGHALTSGLAMVADEMAAPVGPEFRQLHDQQNYGLPLPDAMRAFAERVPLLDAKFFVTAVMTQRESGGNLSEILDNLASVIRDRFKVKRQIRVISAHGRLTGMVLTAVPLVLAAVVFTVSPQNLQLLMTDPLGIRMIIGAVFLQVTGGLIIRKLVQIEY